MSIGLPDERDLADGEIYLTGYLLAFDRLIFLISVQANKGRFPKEGKTMGRKGDGESDFSQQKIRQLRVMKQNFSPSSPSWRSSPGLKMP